MAKSPKAPPVQGAAKSSDLLLAVGAAISWWEGSEDVLMGLFKALCAAQEPTAFEVYVASPRGRRGEMLKAAIRRYEQKFQGQEAEQARSAMKALDRLAAIRNEIAHGHCSEVNGQSNGTVTMEGFYWLPSFNEGLWHPRTFRYAHTTSTISEFIREVREHRAIVMDITDAIMIREQEKGNILAVEHMPRDGAK